MAGPIARNYKRGSIIYFEGDVGSEIYILKQGRVVLAYTLVESGKEAQEELKPGEFFGVRSTLGNFPREETAQTLTDSSVLVLQQPDFEDLMGKNFRLLMKMMRVFSNQLRDMGKRVRNILGDTEIKNPSIELLKLAEYYYQNNNIPYARYAYQRYLKVYSNQPFVGRAQEMLQRLDSGQSFPGKHEPLHTSEAAEQPILTAEPDFPTEEPETVQPQPEPTSPQPQAVEPDLGPQDSEGEFFLESSEIPFDINNPGGADVGGDLGSWGSSVSERLQEAQSLLENDQQEMAAQNLRQLTEEIDAGSLLADEESAAKALYLSGTCALDMNDLSQAKDAFSRVVKEFGEGPYMKPAMLHLGKVFHKAGKSDSAKALYQKVIAIGSEDQWTDQAREMQQRIEVAHA